MKYINQQPFHPGCDPMVSAKGAPEMMDMELGVVSLKAGGIMQVCYAQEVIYDLLRGAVYFPEL